MKQKIVVMDTETGGLDPKKHSLLQVALVVFEDGNEIDSLKLNVVHDVYNTTEKAMEINGIDLETHVGYFPDDVAEQVVTFMQKHFEEPAQVCGHNVQFDVGFFKEMFAYANLDYDKVFSYRLLDTSAVARFLIFTGMVPNRGSLGDLAKFFNIDFVPNELHDALVDCRVTYQLLTAMAKFVQPSEITA